MMRIPKAKRRKEEREIQNKLKEKRKEEKRVAKIIYPPVEETKQKITIPIRKILL